MNKYPKPETAHELIERANAAIDRGIEADTIERCAQRVEAMENILPSVRKAIAAAIRAMKDESSVR